MSSFKVKLRVPNNGTPKGGAGSPDGSDTAGSPVEELSVPETPLVVEPESSPAPMPLPSQPTSGAPPSSAEGTPESTPADSSPAPDGKASKKSAKQRRSSSTHAPNSISAVAASLTLEELDALPSAKRRKSLKTRGAPGPGRGWRKGLSKGQKPVYRLPDMNRSTADVTHDPSKLAVQASTPSSFSGSNGPSRKSKSASSAAKVESGPLLSATIKVSPNSPDAVFKYPSIPSLKDAPALLPLPRVPNVIPTITPLQRSDLKPRHWRHSQREIMSIGGRPWRAPVWLSEGDVAAPDEAEEDDSSEAPGDVSVAQSDADLESKT